MLQNIYSWLFWHSIFVICISLFIGSGSMAFFEVKPYDSIAGYGTEIQIQGNSGDTVKIYVQPPQGDLFVDTKPIGINGKLTYIVPANYTTGSGVYTVVVVEEDQSYADGYPHEFEIFPDDPSSLKSNIIANTTGNLGEKVRVTVQLRDQYLNPISDHRAEVLSDRSSDDITPVTTEKTDRFGEVDFYITASDPGLSTLYAKDTSYDITFDKPHQIRFNANFLTGSSFSGDLTGDLSESFGSVSRFQIDFPKTVAADDDANYLTITALDSNGRTVQDFEGTIKIVTPAENNSILPGDEGVYTFSIKDQGEITFSRALVFPNTGTYTLEIYEYDEKTKETNKNIFGKISVIVKDPVVENGGNSVPVIITSPSTSANFSESDISITGTGLPNSDVKIVLDEVPVLEAEVSSKGNFTALLKNVSEGAHTLYIYQKEDKKSVSDTIEFTIDTKASSIIAAQFSPTKTRPNEEVTVTIDTENSDDIKSVTVSWTGGSTVLKLVGKNTYKGTFKAPSTEGTYTLSATIKDDLQNINEKTLSPSLIVSKEGNTTGDAEKYTPKGLKATYNSTTEEVELEWNSISPSPLLYIVHSGKNLNDLEKVKSISGKTPKTTIKNLKEGKYVFAISAVGNDGSEGALSSHAAVTISISTPTPTPKVPTFTPKTPTPTTIPKEINPLLFVTPQSNALAVRWQRYNNANSYRVLYGLSSHNYAAESEISNTQTSLTLPDLIPETIYYISLEALDANERVLFRYEEKTGVPLASTFHPAGGSITPYPTWITETGPRIFLFLGGVFCFFSVWIFTRRDEQR